MYKKIPANLFNHPSITMSKLPCINNAAHRISIATIIITRIKDKKGSQRIPTFVFLCSHWETTTENFNATAIPIKKAKKENTATTKPFR